jgi:uncharacterized membrane protein
MHVKHHIKACFKTGLVILLPLTIAIAVFLWLISVLLEKHAFTLLWLSRVFACLLLFFFPLIFGLFAAKKPFFFFTLDRFFLRLPLLGSVYRFSLEIAKATLGNRKSPFKKASLFSFPQTNSFVLGFQAGDIPIQIQKKDLVDTCFFIPTAPYPLSNFLLLTKQTELHSLQSSTNDIFQFVISCGTATLPEPKEPPHV